VVTIDTESQMSAGGKQGSVKAKFRVERRLDDDAHLIDGGDASLEITMDGTGAASALHAGANVSTAGGLQPFEESGFNIFHPEEAQHTADLMNGMFVTLQAMAEAMLTGALSGGEPPWESGRCVDLQVRSDPAKRKGARPNTAYTLFAEPRAKSDGMPTGGTVKATLNGANRLNPTGKVKADATFDYANPEKKEQSATIDFEARSRRGVGKATLEFDTRKSGYRVTGGGGDPVDQVVCTIDTPFVLEGKLFGVKFSGGLSGSYTFVRTPNIPGLSWKAHGSYSIVFPNGEDKPGTLTTSGGGTTTAGSQSRTTRGGERFTLTPVEDCGGAP
jgi:hypothetical protein